MLQFRETNRHSPALAVAPACSLIFGTACLLLIKPLNDGTYEAAIQEAKSLVFAMALLIYFCFYGLVDGALSGLANIAFYLLVNSLSELTSTKDNFIFVCLMQILGSLSLHITFTIGDYVACQLHNKMDYYRTRSDLRRSDPRPVRFLAKSTIGMVVLLAVGSYLSGIPDQPLENQHNIFHSRPYHFDQQVSISNICMSKFLQCDELDATTSAKCAPAHESESTVRSSQCVFDNLTYHSLHRLFILYLFMWLGKILWRRTLQHANCWWCWLQ